MKSITLTFASQALIHAYLKGYRIEGNQAFSPKKSSLKLNLKQGYPTFFVKYMGNSVAIKAHRLLAFQKYGMSLFQKGMEVRHLNGVSSDFSCNNIAMARHQKTAMIKHQK